VQVWKELPPVDALAWLSPMAGRGALGELALDHVGVAVYDVEAAIDQFSFRLGLHDWQISTFSTTSTYRGEDQVVGGKVATAAMGPINLELVQPTQGLWTPVDFLEKRGEGLYHLGFRVPDLAAAARRAQEAGLDCELLAIQDEDPVFTYTDPDDLLGITVELVGSRIPAAMITSSANVR
jgi:methylmalonyl-CoA/ethylmalonyl-CoA epimerase